MQFVHTFILEKSEYQQIVLAKFENPTTPEISQGYMDLKDCMFHAFLISQLQILIDTRPSARDVMIFTTSQVELYKPFMTEAYVEVEDDVIKEFMETEDRRNSIKKFIDIDEIREFFTDYLKNRPQGTLYYTVRQKTIW